MRKAKKNSILRPVKDLYHKRVYQSHKNEVARRQHAHKNFRRYPWSASKHIRNGMRPRTRPWPKIADPYLVLNHNLTNWLHLTDSRTRKLAYLIQAEAYTRLSYIRKEDRQLYMQHTSSLIKDINEAFNQV